MTDYVLYGKGKLGQMAVDYCKRIGIEPIAHLDKNSFIHEFEAVKHATAVVCVAAEPYYPIRGQLGELGFIKVMHFYELTEQFKDKCPIGNGWVVEPITKIRKSWSDLKSEEHYVQFAAWRTLKIELNLSEIIDDKFFIPEIQLGDNETFVDVGAYHGHISDKFIKRVNDFKALVAIEPDPANYAQLAALFDYPDKRITTYEVAITDWCGTANFYQGLELASRVCHNSNTEVEARTIDSLRLEPTYIKFHTEGYELNGLRGAKNTLLKYRPIIAVTAYHSEDGLTKIPLWLMETLPNYDFLFRLHAWCGQGAVIYAIPKERHESPSRATH